MSEIGIAKIAVDHALLEHKRWLFAAAGYARARAVEGDEMARIIAEKLDETWDAMIAEGLWLRTVDVERKKEQ